MRILVYTPLHPDYGIKPQALTSIEAAISAYDGAIDWILSSNDNPHKEPYANVTYQHNKAREMVLNGDYDALLSIEADMIIPPDTIERLIEVDADIAYGLYVWRHRIKRWNAYMTLNLWGGESVSYNYSGQDVDEAWGKIIDVAGLGMGCTLIQKRVLEQIQFRLLDGEHSWIVDEYKDEFNKLGVNPYRDRSGMVCDDWLLALDAQHYGFSQRANMNVICGHIAHDTVLWPNPRAAKFYRTEPI